MAASKSSNSSKTAHVMNLLRKNEPAQPQEKNAGAEPAPAVDPAPAAAGPSAPAAPPAVPAAQEAQAPRANPQIPPILTSLNADAEISDQIRDALETALTESAAAEAPPAQAVSAPAMPHVPAAPAAQQPPVEPPAPAEPGIPDEPEIQAKAAPPQLETPPAPRQVPPPPEARPVIHKGPVEPQPTAPQAPAPAPAEIPVRQDKPAQEEPSTGASFYNVMQSLTEDRAQKYIDLFGLCTCRRCRDDVIALTLNNLPPLYVVMPTAELTARRDMYGNRFNSEITAQLLRACKEVMDHPRHDE